MVLSVVRRSHEMAVEESSRHYQTEYSRLSTAADTLIGNRHNITFEIHAMGICTRCGSNSPSRLPRCIGVAVRLTSQMSVGRSSEI